MMLGVHKYDHRPDAIEPIQIVVRLNLSGYAFSAYWLKWHVDPLDPETNFYMMPLNWYPIRIHPVPC